MLKARRRRYRMVYTVRLEPGQAAEFDAMLRRKGLTRSAYLRSLIADDLARS